jgi:hypothetical protein
MIEIDRDRSVGRIAPASGHAGDNMAADQDSNSLRGMPDWRMID